MQKENNNDYNTRSLSMITESSLNLFNGSSTMGDQMQYRPYNNIRPLGTRNLYFIDNTLVVSHSGNNRVHLLDCISGNYRWFDHHTETVRDIKSFGNLLITSGWDGAVRSTDLMSLKQRQIFTEKTMGRCPYSAIRDDGQYLASSSYDSDKDTTLRDNILRVWDLKTGNLEHKILLPGNHLFSNRNSSADFFEGKLYAISDSGMFCIYNSDFQLEYNYSFKHNVRTLLIVPEHRKVLLGIDIGDLYIFDIQTKNMYLAAKINNPYLNDLIFDPNKNLIFGSACSGAVYVWNYPEFRLLSAIKINLYLWKSVVIGDKLFIGGSGGPICIFDIAKPDDIRQYATLGIYKDFYLLKQNANSALYTNAPIKIGVFDSNNKCFIDRKAALNIIGLHNNIEILHRTFNSSTMGVKLSQSNNPILPLCERN